MHCCVSCSLFHFVLVEVHPYMNGYGTFWKGVIFQKAQSHIKWMAQLPNSDS